MSVAEPERKCCTMCAYDVSDTNSNVTDTEIIIVYH